MKKKLIAVLLAVLALTAAAVTVFAADTPAYIVDENGNITLDVVINLKGDVNNDGVVNSDDVTYLLCHVASVEEISDTYQLECGEVIGDSSVDSDDVTKLLQYVAGIIPSLD